MEDGLRCFHLCRDPRVAPSWRGADSHASRSRQEHTAKSTPLCVLCAWGGGRDGGRHIHREYCRREAIMKVISKVTQSCTVSSLASMRLQSELTLTKKGKITKENICSICILVY